MVIFYSYVKLPEGNSVKQYKYIEDYEYNMHSSPYAQALAGFPNSVSMIFLGSKPNIPPRILASPVHIHQWLMITNGYEWIIVTDGY